MPACRHFDPLSVTDQQDDQVEFDVRGDHSLQHGRAAVHDPVILM
jgi:hypothetical protein